MRWRLLLVLGAGRASKAAPSYTRLWAADYLQKADPCLTIVIVEERFAGFGAWIKFQWGGPIFWQRRFAFGAPQNVRGPHWSIRLHIDGTAHL